jgi:DNA-binding transcriptional LysR family regulator
MDFVRTLTLRQLQIFVAAARHNSFVRAAEELHLTQPAVSMQIKQLESVVGMELFERAAGRLVLTDPGARFLRHANRILGDVKDAEEEVKSLTTIERGSISFGLVLTAKYFAPRLLARFSVLHPGIELRFSEGNREGLRRLLQDNAIDLALMGRPPAELDALAEPLAYHPHVIVAPATHRLAGLRSLDLQELREETFLLREQGSGTRTVAEQMFKNHLFTPAKVITLGSNETIKQAVMAGLGVSLLSLHTLMLELRTSQIALLDMIGTPIERTWHIVHMRHKVLSPACQAFRTFLLDETAPYLEETCAGMLPE